MKRITLLISILVFLVGFQGKAQELANYNLYMQNGYLYNSAHTVGDAGINAFLNTHMQWAGFVDAPRVNTLGVHGAISENSGLGITVFQNTAGAVRNLLLRANYGYRAKISDEHYLRLGVGVGLTNDNLSGANTFSDLTDPLLQTEALNGTNFSASAGLSYFIKGFEAQFIMPQVFWRKELNHYSIGILSYHHAFNDDWSVKPSVLVRGLNTSPMQYDLNLMGAWREKLWLQAGYRSNQSFIMSLGINVSDFELAYAFQVNGSELAKVSNGTHEIQLVYRFGENFGKASKPKNAAVSGVVKNALSNKPITNAEIIILDENGAEITRTKTDANGNYNLQLPVGNTFTAKVSAPDYHAEQEMIVMPEEGTDTNMNLNLKPTKIKVSGKTVPPGAKVNIYDQDGKLVYTQTADENGNYEAMLEPGKEYRVVTSAPGYEDATQNLQVSGTTQTQEIDTELVPFKDIVVVLKNADTGEPVTAVLTLKDPSGKLIDKKNVSGEYRYTTKPGNYMAEVSGENVLSQKANVIVKKDSPKEVKTEMNIKLMADNTFSLGTVVFESAKAIVKPESLPVLDELVKIMKDNPEYQIEIQGHTDNVGSKANNTKLSQQRAETCMEYVISKGIAAERLTAKGFGPDKPLVPNTSVANRAKNRRVEFKLKK